MSITTIAVTKPVGSGIIESGSNAYGEYEIFGNGRIHMTGWGFVTWTSGAAAVSKTLTLPYEVSDSKLIRGGLTPYGYKATDPTSITDVSGAYGLQFDILCSASTTQITIRATYPSAIANTDRQVYTFDIWARWS